MNDYTWPSIFFAYFFFSICLVLAVFFFFRSLKSGYWSKEGEDLRFQVFDEKERAAYEQHQQETDHATR